MAHCAQPKTEHTHENDFVLRHYLYMPFNLMEIFMVSIKFCYFCMGWLMVDGWSEYCHSFFDTNDVHVHSSLGIVFHFHSIFHFMLDSMLNFFCLISFRIRGALRIEHKEFVQWKKKMVIFQSHYKWLWLNAYLIYIISFLSWIGNWQLAIVGCIHKNCWWWKLLPQTNSKTVIWSLDIDRFSFFGFSSTIIIKRLVIDRGTF